MNVKEDVSKMMNQILRESRHNDNFHEDNWDTTGVQIRKPKYEENDHFEILEEYLKMSPEELKQAKEEEWQRIQSERISKLLNYLIGIKAQFPSLWDAIEYCKFLIDLNECDKRADDIPVWLNFTEDGNGVEFFAYTQEFKATDTVSSLKKRIKHCKNPLEKKNLERQLNGMYKERKRQHDQCGKSIYDFPKC